MAIKQGFGQESRTTAAVKLARTFVADALDLLAVGAVADQAAVVASELVTNAVLHGDGVVSVSVTRRHDAVRIEVEDRTRDAPFMGLLDNEGMTGRGLLLISSMAARWGTDVLETGKVVWAELVPGHEPAARSEAELLVLWDDPGLLEPLREVRHRVVLGEVPTQLLLAAKTHVDNLVREFTLAASGAADRSTAPLPPNVATLIDTVTTRFSEARQAIKRQAVEAARRGDSRVSLELFLPAEAAAAGEAYLLALDQSDVYSRAARLLTLETPPQHRLFRRWYVGELVRQLRAAASGIELGPSETFEQRLLREIDATAEAQRASDRGARLYEVAAALSSAVTSENVAAAVVEHGVTALGASGGGLLFATREGALTVPATLGYDDAVVARLRAESRSAELPAAQALRTGEAVWLESPEELDARFPELRGLEWDTVSLCAVPLVAGGRRLGALRFSFSTARLFDEQERRFVLALAAQTAQALDRAQLQEERLDMGRRLQRSLLPGRLPAMPGLDVAGIYHPLGDEMELGGDYYDVWPLTDGRFGVAIGDASGTGPEAAARSALVRVTLRALTAAGIEPAEALRRLNSLMLEGDADDAFAERFCTVALGVVTPGEPAHVVFYAGGHPFPLLRRAGGRTEEVPLGGSLIGIIQEPEVARSDVVLERGDVVVLITDGAPEARGEGRMLGMEAVCQAVDAAGAEAAEVARAVEAVVLAHTGGVLTDDLAVLVLRAT